MAPDQAAGLVRAALAGQTGDATVADAATRAGLALRDAELGLHRLLQVHRGHLSVTDKGELLFRFPTGFAIDYERRGRARALARWVGRGVAAIAKWIVRVGLAVFLVGYALVFAVGLLVAAIALSIVAEDGAPLEGVGYLVWGMFELVSDALFWGVHPRASLVAADDDERHPRAFYDKVNRLFFGPPHDPEDPQALPRLLAAEIRARRGRIGLGDVVRVTGLPRPEAEAMVSRLLVDYDGEVDVTEAGAIVYRFPDLRPTAGPAALPPAPAMPVPAIWRGAVAAEPFTGNSTGSNAAILGLTAFVAMMGAFGTWLGLPFWAAELPLFATLAFLVVPIVRFPFHVARRGAIAEENGRRALLQAVHESACEARGVDEDELAKAWHDAAHASLPATELRRRLFEMGGDVVVDDLARATWRFPELEVELRALSDERARASDHERDAGTIEFTSVPAEESSPALALPAETAPAVGSGRV